MPVQVEADRLRRQVDIIKVPERLDQLPEVQLGEPGPGRRAPQPLHVPVLDAGERRRGARQDAHDERDHGREQRRVLAPDDHAHAAGQAVDAVEVDEVGEEGRAPRDDGHGQQQHQRREVHAAEHDARDHARVLGEEVGDARVARLGLASVQQHLLREDPHAGRRRHEADGDGCQER